MLQVTAHIDWAGVVAHQGGLTTKVRACTDQVQQTLWAFERKYKYIWSQDKDAYVRWVRLAT